MDNRSVDMHDGDYDDDDDDVLFRRELITQ